MNYLSICSGIEAATVAWHHLGFKPLGFSEIEPFPSAVLAYHYPEVKNFGDMTKHKEWTLNDRIDLLVGGTPCQAFSVAGARRGLEDERGNLTLTFCNIADQFNPEFTLWENVPGVLSDKTNAFGCLLSGLAGFDEVLKSVDGKWRGSGMVIGRRRRVAWVTLDAQFFGVPQRRRRIFVLAVDAQSVADSPDKCPSKILAIGQSLRRDTPSRRKEGEIAPTIPSRSSAGGGLGTDLDGGLQVCFRASGRSGYRVDDKAEALRASGAKQTDVDLVLKGFHTTGAGYWQEGAGTLRAREQDSHENVILTFDRQSSGEYGTDTVASTVSARDYKSASDLMISGSPSFAVRRLTPEECEILQAFPVGYTNIPWRKKPESPDGPRYKALGNSMCTSVMRWIGERINETRR